MVKTKCSFIYFANKKFMSFGQLGRYFKKENPRELGKKRKKELIAIDNLLDSRQRHVSKMDSYG